MNFVLINLFFLRQLFEIDTLTGIVSYQSMNQILPKLNLIKLTFDVRLVELTANMSVGLDINSDTAFLMQDTRDLARLSDMVVYLNIIVVANANESGKVDFKLQAQFEQISRMNNKFFPIRITQLKNGQLNFDILEIIASPGILRLEVIQVLKLDLNSSLTDTIVQGLFKINAGMLIYNTASNGVVVVPEPSTLYYLTLRVCQYSQCIHVNLTVQVEFNFNIITQLRCCYYIDQFLEVVIGNEDIWAQS